MKNEKGPWMMGFACMVLGIILALSGQIYGLNKNPSQLAALIGGFTALGGTLIASWALFKGDDGQNSSASLYVGPAFIGAGTLVSAIGGYFS